VVAADSGPAASPGSAWAPFRHRLFAAMWGAQFVSNIGSWMQTVAAQWLMLTLTGSATYVALVQTAAGLPVVLFAIVAGPSPGEKQMRLPGRSRLLRRPRTPHQPAQQPHPHHSWANPNRWLGQPNGSIR